MSKPIGYTLYNGPSLVDGSPILVIATLHSANTKTGDMIQTWVLPRDTPPHIAAITGQDSAVCGSCPLRPSATNVCYVQLPRAPLQVWKSYHAGRYPPVTNYDWCVCHTIRIGSYGDPAVVPIHIWQPLIYWANDHTGYTHLWREPYSQDLRTIVQASCDTIADVIVATNSGWHTFLITPDDSPSTYQNVIRKTGQPFITCPAHRQRNTCATCLLCNGQRAHILIPVHGSTKSHFTGVST